MQKIILFHSIIFVHTQIYTLGKKNVHMRKMNAYHAYIIINTHKMYMEYLIFLEGRELLQTRGEAGNYKLKLGRTEKWSTIEF